MASVYLIAEFMSEKILAEYDNSFSEKPVRSKKGSSKGKEKEVAARKKAAAKNKLANQWCDRHLHLPWSTKAIAER
jgi:hypothetical protein